MSHCCDTEATDQSEASIVPSDQSEAGTEMNGVRCCDSRDRPVVTRVSLTMGPGEIKGAAPGPHTSPDVTTEGAERLVVVTIITPAPGCSQLWRRPHYHTLSRGLTSSGDINAGQRIDHDWAGPDWRQLVCTEVTTAGPVSAISISDHFRQESHTLLQRLEDP